MQRSGHIHVHPKRSETPQQWAFMLAHCLLHLAMELFERDRADWPAWCAACDVVTTRFLLAIKLGPNPDDRLLPDGLPGWDEPRWYASFCGNGVPDWAGALSLAGAGSASMDLPAALERSRAHPLGAQQQHLG